MSRLLTWLVAVQLLMGCASVSPGPSPAAQRVDPWEPWNRKVYAFNDTVDRSVLAPVAQGYRDHVPSPVRSGVGNVFNNFADLWSTANHLLQNKVQPGAEMGARVITNTVLGVLGVFDVATLMGLARQPEDFGQTLGVWGLASGPYLVLPLLGPSSVRDGVGVATELSLASPSQLASATAGQVAITGLQAVQARANLLDTTALLDDVALDRYSFTRDAYLQRRQSLVHDGSPPVDFEDFEDGPAADAPLRPQ
ncbi:lipoprotein [Pseudomonas sp. Cab53]|uniref:ABC transporter n=1 Tax=Pseudomonas chlororaphis TaxID=587753 RepID=A0A0G3GMZ6_9PSED|nr:VacJ family lipoprotein [Pseudomonas sp. Cab53]AKK00923.1 ABC transporter [Pseudomonas chlororaphis]BBP65599.1 lipoprotein [Pseudomonas sp. Cab53]